ncbi:Zn-dependent hydrolase [Nitratireductor aquibiodomus RA22]|uniref:Zn-dependent hydrolase n=1 Tax=Nitratireductor aquibiodomus RA22 TaxID=1189611 RepID=I5BQE4_9HYPH|nr:Zn-dependent hydrolase [Nitratireductor aquibiodomus RA22]
MDQTYTPREADAAAKATTARPDVTVFFDQRTFSAQYVVADPATGKCAIIDPVLDFDEKSGSTSTENADRLLAFVAGNGLELEWILDTHPHADHFSAASYLKEKTGRPIAIGERVIEVQKLWKTIYNWPEFKADGSQWDRLFADGDTFTIGSLPARVMFSPGHTLASITYVIGDAAFVHDTLFMPDSGTARCDFPGGSAERLWKSIQTFSACRTRPAYLSVTIISRAGANLDLKALSPNRRRQTLICRNAKRKPISLPSVKRATGPCQCQSSSCTHCR